MTTPTDPLGRAWDALDIGPWWAVAGPVQRQPALAAAATSDPVDAAAPETAADDQPLAGPAVARAASPHAAVASMSWEQLQQSVAGCQRCGLCESRRNTVFGTGDRRPRWLVVGEAPGAQEDERGEPFVGEAGRLLDAMLGAVGASRENGVFILNVLKCRPPRNRDPAPDEVASCAEFLQRQVELLEPELIFTMGRFAAQALLKTDKGIGALRQQVHEVQIGSRSVPLVAGYHPAYLLRQPQEKARAWQDICLARSVCQPTSAG